MRGFFVLGLSVEVNRLPVLGILFSEFDVDSQ